MEEKTIPMFKVKLGKIPKDELKTKIEKLFGPGHTLLDGDALTVRLKFSWVENYIGEYFPVIRTVTKTDYDSHVVEIIQDSFLEPLAVRHRAFLSIIEDNRLAPEDITFLNGFEKEDLDRIAYIKLQIYGIKTCLHREHCNFLFEGIKTIDPQKLSLYRKNTGNVTLDIPPQYFKDGKAPIVPEIDMHPYISVAEFNYLIDNEVLTEGSLSLDRRTELTSEEKGYIKWLSGEINKPRIETKINEESLFLDLFKDDIANQSIKF